MPAILHPDEVVEKRPSRRIDEGDTGGGRLPPIEPKHTGGGGDGDNWNNKPVGRRGPRERLGNYRRGLFFALAGDLMFFVAIVCAFFATKHSGHIDAYNHWVYSWVPIAIPSILWLNTGALLISSITIELARRSIFREIDVMEEWLGMGTPTRKRVMPWLAVSTLLGLTFLWGQYLAWKQLAREPIFVRGNQSSRFFYLITGIHGVHLLLGIALLIAAFIGMRTVKQIESRQILVDCSAWYWHTMGALWIFLFGLLIYGQ
ncbi:heme/copper-type cytochrome/quinol oxidase, subunit 3 [Terriglobus roseus DSM 18391]|uniref:Heme/copper-type cytochrome/quinol oxidase, subunit 3 n=1 Tax=Terriglobus roseus (strain DSM 18391 / NRRL B-41598 / KBS 63) TaxID=926566 RepID=I3ZG82_TERRK|nr:cytochrome c oxidase subunit 3 [Terriglobus roseus]AFL88250.1 heme/copper-type cytochrome/quinol oxidase, subunit 3 [Terriglobus roseus DSM 18391]AFL88591.1 heme/copper-type cytochrome/quinol oxidase, subunit 3 [Terriglobus roseus DSM 18391]